MMYLITKRSVARMTPEKQIDLLKLPRLQAAILVRDTTRYPEVRELAEARIAVLKKSKNPVVLYF